MPGVRSTPFRNHQKHRAGHVRVVALRRGRKQNTVFVELQFSRRRHDRPDVVLTVRRVHDRRCDAVVRLVPGDEVGEQPSAIGPLEVPLARIRPGRLHALGPERGPAARRDLRAGRDADAGFDDARPLDRLIARRMQRRGCLRAVAAARSSWWWPMKVAAPWPLPAASPATAWSCPPPEGRRSRCRWRHPGFASL